MESIKVTWAEMKAFLDQRNVPVNFVEWPAGYNLVGMDAAFKMHMFLKKTDPASSDQTDFETNYKPNGNKTFSDSDGNTYARTKMTKTGWSYQLHTLTMTTAKALGCRNGDKFGNDLGFMSNKMYDVSRVETQTEASAKFSQFLWTPNHDYMALQGILTQAAPPASDLCIWITAAPGIADIPFSQGGIDLSMAGGGKSIEADGKAAKPLYYNNPIPGTNTFEIWCEHAVGYQHRFQLHLGIFRP